MRRLAVLAAIAMFLSAITVPRASAIEIAGFSARIDVDQDGGACGTVKDTLTNASYTVVLTATGFESKVTANGAILDAATASGNPARACIPSGLVPPVHRVVQYTLEWTSVLGTTGSLVRTCLWVGDLWSCTIT